MRYFIIFCLSLIMTSAICSVSVTGRIIADKKIFSEIIVKLKLDGKTYQESGVDEHSGWFEFLNVSPNKYLFEVYKSGKYITGVQIEKITLERDSWFEKNIIILDK